MKSKIHTPNCGIGFTLVELLVVIAIIALLLGILVAGVGKARAAAEKAATNQYMGTIVLSLSAYEHDFNAYPPSYGTGITGTGPTFTTFGVTNDTMTTWKGSELLAQALVGQFASDNHTGPGWAQSTTSKVYGSYVNTGEHGIIESPITSGAYVLCDSWDQPIQYYRANNAATTLWDGRFLRADNTTTTTNPPTQKPADDTVLRSAKFLLLSIGADVKASGMTGATNSSDNDNVVVTGP